MDRSLLMAVAGLSLGLLMGDSAGAQTGVTYQGRLNANGAPANGIFDFEFVVYTSAAGSTFMATVSRPDLQVNNGLFTTLLTGLESNLAQGLDRWLEVRVRPGASTGAFTVLSPRVQFSSAPYSLFSFRPWVTGQEGALWYRGGNVGIGDDSPAATLSVGLGDKFQVNGDTGSVRFPYNTSSIEFPATNISAAPMISMFSSGISNANRMVLSHSPNNVNWGLEYQDVGDRFHFRNANGPGVTIDLPFGRIGIGQSQPDFPLSFSNSLGDKISLWGTSGEHYGFGIQNSLLQIFTAHAVDSIAFGHGQSNAFTETMRVRGDGSVQIGTTVAVGRLSVDWPDGSAIYASTNAGQAAGAVWGVAGGTNGRAVVGLANGPGQSFGVWGRVGSGAPEGWAGWFSGRTHVVGPLSASGGKSFRIDHPLDPLNKYLYHYAIESPEALNMYRGTVTLDARGEAVVELPDYFEAMNRTFAYTLTAVGSAMPSLHVSQEIEGRVFRIAGGAPGKRVSWMVTAQRADAAMLYYGAPVEVEKPEALRGAYQDAEAFGLSQAESEAFRGGEERLQPKR